MSGANNLFYNHKTKEDYLNTIENEDVKHLYAVLFSRSKSTEEMYQKDLHSFNLSQIEEVMKSLNPTTFNSAINSKSRINMYITWAIQNGRRPNNINPLHGTTTDWEKKFVDQTRKRYLSESDLYDLVDGLINYQDKALVQCIFEGISGKGMSELLSLNINNIDWENNEVIVKDEKDESPRRVKVSDRCLLLIKEAYAERKYTSEITGATKPLIENEGAVFKNTRWKNTKKREADRSTLAKRLYTIKEKYKLDEFSVITISESGRIKMAVDLYKKYGKLTKKEFAMIGDHFNLTKITANGHTYHNVAIMKHYINSKNIKELYDIEIEL